MVKELKNGIKFVNVNCKDEELENEVIQDLEKISDRNGLDYVYLRNDSLEAVNQSTLWYGFKGLNVNYFYKEWCDKFAELNKYRSESVTRSYMDKFLVTIKSSYGDHIFTEEELDKLFKGESITITFNTKYGNSRTVSGKIEQKDWAEKEIKFYTFVTHDLDNQASQFIETTINGKPARFKGTFADYTFTEEDIRNFSNNRSVYAIITNSNGNRSSVKLDLEHVDNDYFKVQPNWDVPRCRFSVRDKEFTAEQIKNFDYGRSETVELISKAGKAYTTELRWRDGQYQIKKSNNYDGYGNGDADSF